MTKQEIAEVQKSLESIVLNCESRLATDPADEIAQSDWQHATTAISRLRFQRGNPASAANGRKGGRPKKTTTNMEEK